MTLDDLDFQILNELQRDARISNAELARRLNLSPPATHARVKRLEDIKFIDRFVTLLDRKMANYDMLCFVNISLQLHDVDQVSGFHKAVQEIPEVLHTSLVLREVKNSTVIPLK